MSIKKTKIGIVQPVLADPISGSPQSSEEAEHSRLRETTPPKEDALAEDEVDPATVVAPRMRKRSRISDEADQLRKRLREAMDRETQLEQRLFELSQAQAVSPEKRETTRTDFVRVGSSATEPDPVEGASVSATRVVTEVTGKPEASRIEPTVTTIRVTNSEPPSIQRNVESEWLVLKEYELQERAAGRTVIRHQHVREGARVTFDMYLRWYSKQHPLPAGVSVEAPFEGDIDTFYALVKRILPKEKTVVAVTDAGALAGSFSDYAWHLEDPDALTLLIGHLQANCNDRWSTEFFTEEEHKTVVRAMLNSLSKEKLEDRATGAVMTKAIRDLHPKGEIKSIKAFLDLFVDVNHRRQQAVSWWMMEE